MKKIIFMALAALFLLTGCDKGTTTVVGNGTVVCTPSNLNLKVGESQAFQFVVKDSSIDELIWRSSNEGSSFELMDGNKINVTGREAGKEDIIYCYDPRESSTSHTVLGGVKVVVTK